MDQIAEKAKFALTIENNGIETIYSLEEGKEIIVGADPQAEIPIEDDYLSFRHFSIKVEADTLEVTDLGSRNGLFLKLENSVKIIPGQSLLAGKTIIKITEASND